MLTSLLALAPGAQGLRCDPSDGNEKISERGQKVKRLLQPAEKWTTHVGIFAERWNGAENTFLTRNSVPVAPAVGPLRGQSSHPYRARNLVSFFEHHKKFLYAIEKFKVKVRDLQNNATLVPMEMMCVSRSRQAF
jgi:hypothetical protein